VSGPRSLKSLLAGWNPRPGHGGAPNADQASAAFAVAWEQAVGAEVARRSRPMRFANGTLNVLTASSAWSDELSLHAPRIIQALQRAFPGEQIRKLRFMVASGRTRLLLDGERYRARDGVSPRPFESAPDKPSPPPTADRIDGEEDIAAAVARLAASQHALDAERDRAGWHTCRSCGRRFAAQTAGSAQCAPCAENARRAAQATIERALMQAPWLSAAAAQQMFAGMTVSAYERTRQRLLARWQSEIEAAQRRLRRGATSAEDRVVAWSYLMLLSGLPQRDIGRAVVSEVLGREWVGVLFGEAAAQNQEARRTQRENHNR
jgi:hypothetical protein